jgi:probable F420-dependent oxidoreductase
MTKLELGRVGISLDVTGDDSYLHAAREIERLGYPAIWLAGGQLDSVRRIADVVHATERIRVVPGIIPLDVYTAAEVAALYAELEESAPGRFVAGLGGPQTAKPLRALHSFLDALDSAEPPVPRQRRILAALGPRKLAIARERCAGAVPLLVTPEYTAGARGALGADGTLAVDQLVVLDTDADRARATARRPLGFLSGVAGYRDNFARMGFTETEIAELADRLVDELVAWGDGDAIMARVEQHLGAGADHVVLGVLAGDGQPASLEVARRLADRLPAHI